MTARFLKSGGFIRGLSIAKKVMDVASVTTFVGVTGGIVYMMMH